MQHFVNMSVIDNTSPMLRHAWHAVATSEEVGDEPTQVMLLGEPWVLARLGGELVAFVDRLPAPPGAAQRRHHRRRRAAVRLPRLALRRRRVGARPSRRSGPTSHIPSRADATPAWGVQERYGMVWLAPAEPLTDISRFPEYERRRVRHDLDHHRPHAGRAPAQLVDNFLDASHFPFVHTGTFGDEKASEVVDEGIERDGWLVRTVFSTWYKNFDDPLVATGEHPDVQPQDLLKEGGASTTVYLRLFFPVTGATLSILFVCTPESADSTRIYKLVARDDLAGDPARIAQTVVDEDLILAEDLAVLERYARMEIHLDPRVEVHTKGDRLSLAWRRLLAEWLAAVDATAPDRRERDPGRARHPRPRTCRAHLTRSPDGRW